VTTITVRDRLPFIAVVLIANGQRLQISDVLLDTGAAASVFRTDDLLTIGVVPSPTDQIRFMAGIGGREAVIEKQIETLAVGNLIISPFTIQLGAVDYGFAINGIMGMDFLLTAGAVIDLHTLTIT
jgi:hypothetical protein